jgi:hypothetical protein
LYLGSHPSPPLLLEIVFTCHFLVKHGDVFLIFYIYALHEQECFKLFVFAGG